MRLNVCSTKDSSGRIPPETAVTQGKATTIELSRTLIRWLDQRLFIRIVDARNARSKLLDIVKSEEDVGNKRIPRNRYASSEVIIHANPFRQAPREM